VEDGKGAQARGHVEIVTAFVSRAIKRYWRSLPPGRSNLQRLVRDENGVVWRNRAASGEDARRIVVSIVCRLISRETSANRRRIIEINEKRVSWSIHGQSRRSLDLFVVGPKRFILNDLKLALSRI